MDRSQKVALVAELEDTFANSSLVVVTRQSGLTVAEMADIRSKMRVEGARFKVTKNRLAKIALKGTAFEAIDSLFSGPTAIATSTDPVAAARVIDKYAKSNKKVEVIGGSLDGNLMDAQGIKELANLPSLDQLRGKLVGILQAPAGKIVGVVQAPARNLAGVFGAYGRTGE